MLRELPALLHARSPPKLTQPELARVVTWKLTKGKVRPNLQRYADEASPAAVEAASQKAFAFAAAGKLRPAIDALTELKGVGPATASAILAAFDPSVPFASDEALMAVVGTREYKLDELLRLTEALRAKAAALNKAEADRDRAAGSARATAPQPWTANRCQLALWAATRLEASGAPASSSGSADGDFRFPDEPRTSSSSSAGAGAGAGAAAAGSSSSSSSSSSGGGGASNGRGRRKAESDAEEEAAAAGGGGGRSTKKAKGK
jgi:uncharacterized membrane protein YgcG